MTERPMVDIKTTPAEPGEDRTFAQVTAWALCLTHLVGCDPDDTTIKLSIAGQGSPDEVIEVLSLGDVLRRAAAATGLSLNMFGDLFDDPDEVHVDLGTIAVATRPAWRRPRPRSMSGRPSMRRNPRTTAPDRRQPCADGAPHPVLTETQHSGGEEG